MVKLFSDADERSAVTTVLAGALLIADVIHCGVAKQDGPEARAFRVEKALQLARQFVAAAEKPGD